VKKLRAQTAARRVMVPVQRSRTERRRRVRRTAVTVMMVKRRRTRK